MDFSKWWPTSGLQGIVSQPAAEKIWLSSRKEALEESLSTGWAFYKLAEENTQALRLQILNCKHKLEDF